VEIDVIVTTWGSDQWKAAGIATAFRNSGHFHHIDSTTVSAGEARNHAVQMLDPQGWICFVDADDNLALGYLEAMEAAYEHERQLLTPALSLGGSTPRCLYERDILNGLNPCPIGTLIHRDLFDEVDGFGDEPAYEDYSMFQRAVLVGAEISFVPDAVYLAGHNPRGRNSTVRNPKRLVEQIRKDNRRWLKA
jgi:hypothetical protein